MAKPRKPQDLAARAAKGLNSSKRLPRRWQAMLIRNHGEVLGTVEAADEQAAQQVAAERYSLTDQQLTRLALREIR